VKSAFAIIFRALLLIQVCLVCLPLQAFDHEPLERDPDLGFDILLQQTLGISPEFLSLASRDQQARAYLEAGKRWIARTSQSADQLHR
jgi:hypothetical protein